jgi:predicted nucleotidyltransferase component of viral defense system
MSKQIKDVAASVRGRLVNIAVKERRTFDSVLLLYMQERLLYRLSISEFGSNFILKGGLLMFMLTEYKGRPTKDIDLLAQQISNDKDDIKRIFLSVCSINYAEDGLVFHGEDIEVEDIKEAAAYHGVRVKTTCYLGNAKKMVQLDIGFGDIVIPKPREMECPVLLDLEAPVIKAYSLESIISEKFQAMIALSVANSRMKDFYDIYTLLSTNNFDGRKLQEAVFETLQRRNTILEKESVIFTEQFIMDESRNRLWESFLRKINVEKFEFREVMEYIEAFLKPIYNSIIGEKEFFMQWDYVNKKWIKDLKESEAAVE